MLHADSVVWNVVGVVVALWAVDIGIAFVRTMRRGYQGPRPGGEWRLAGAGIPSGGERRGWAAGVGGGAGRPGCVSSTVGDDGPGGRNAPFDGSGDQPSERCKTWSFAPGGGANRADGEVASANARAARACRPPSIEPGTSRALCVGCIGARARARAARARRFDVTRPAARHLPPGPAFCAVDRVLGAVRLVIPLPSREEELAGDGPG
jgi:hypothetical protein